MASPSIWRQRREKRTLLNKKQNDRIIYLVKSNNLIPRKIFEWNKRKQITVQTAAHPNIYSIHLSDNSITQMSRQKSIRPPPAGANYISRKYAQVRLRNALEDQTNVYTILYKHRFPLKWFINSSIQKGEQWLRRKRHKFL